MVEEKQSYYGRDKDGNATNKLSKQLKGIGVPGKDIVTGDRSKKFQAFLEKNGLDKQKWLNVADESFKNFSEKLFARAVALEVYQNQTATLVDFMNVFENRGITLYSELVNLSADIEMRKQKKREELGDVYDPLEDKPLVSAQRRKEELIIALNKMKMDYADRLARKEESRLDKTGKIIHVDAVTVDDMSDGGLDDKNF